MSRYSRKQIEEAVFKAFQQAEELGGVEDTLEYCQLIGRIQRRFSNLLQNACINHRQEDNTNEQTN